MGQSLSTQPYPAADLISALPVEIALRVFSHLPPLEATKIRVVCKIWRRLLDNSDLWKFFCLQHWAHLPSDHDTVQPYLASGRWKALFKVLYHGACMFNHAPARAMEFLFAAGVLRSETHSIALFLSSATYLDPTTVTRYMADRHHLLEAFIRLRSFSNMFFPVALRSLFGSLAPTKSRPWSRDTLELAMRVFAEHYCHCNPAYMAMKDDVYILAFTVLLLSADLHNPLVKRKMTKREFLRNTRHIIATFSDDYLCQVYDYVFLFGHVASPKSIAQHRAEILQPVPLPLELAEA